MTEAYFRALRKAADVIDVPGTPTTLRLERVQPARDGVALTWSFFDPVAWANREEGDEVRPRMRGTVHVGPATGDPEVTATAWWARAQLVAARRYSDLLDADWQPGEPWVDRPWTVDEAWQALIGYLERPGHAVRVEEDGIHVASERGDRLEEVYRFRPTEWAAYLRTFTTSILGPVDPAHQTALEIVPAAIPTVDGLPLFASDDLSETMGSAGPAVTLVDGRIVRASHRPSWSEPMPSPTQRPTVSGDLQIVVDTTRPNDPTVRLLVDGVDVLDPERFDTGYDPDSLLDGEALVPMDPPRRVGLYHCRCDTMFCESIAGIVTRRADRIEWTDFRSLTGQYDDHPYPFDDSSDPYAEDTDGTFEPSALDLPTISFDAAQYLQEVARATADRSWESRLRVVIRLVTTRRPQWSLWSGRRDDELTVDTNADRDSRGVLTLPAGGAEHLATSLVALLDAGHHPRTIAERHLWR